MSSSPISNNNVLPEDCLSGVFYFSRGAPKYALVCKSWCAAVKNCYQHVFRDYQRDGKIKPFTLLIQQIALDSPISEAFYEQAVKETYRAVMDRTQAPHIQPAMVSLDPSMPLDLVPVMEIVEDANLVRFFDGLKEHRIPNNAQPVLAGNLTQRAATLRKWMENHQASLDPVATFFGDLIVETPESNTFKRFPLNLTTLPLEIGKCINLQQLELCGNRLAILPQEFFQLTSLRSLNLSDNQITAIPAQIGQLTNLATLSLGGVNQKLVALPKELSELRNLRKLTLSHVRLHNLQQHPLKIGLIANLCALNNIIGALKEEKTEEALELFKGLPADTKNAIYGELYKVILPGLKNDYYGCGEDAFLQRNGQQTSHQNRIRAIENFIDN